ncbi:glycosyltransferase [Candidatus Woesearchaeota archaeon]|nr:glycosyltransferase [Candidatus Woesearchaeota archaeon]
MNAKFFAPLGPGGGGSTEYSLAIQRSLVKANKKIELLNNPNHITKNPLYFINKARKCRNCDVLLTHFNTNLFGRLFGINGVYSLLYYFLVSLKGPKIVTIIHDIPKLRKYSLFSQLCLKILYFPIFFFGTQVIVHNPIAKMDILKYGCPKNKIKIIEHGIDIDTIKIQNNKIAKKKIGFPNKKILLSWGYIRPSKNNEEIIKIMPQLPKNVIFIVVGPGWHDDKKNSSPEDKKYFEYLCRLTKQNKLSDRVFLYPKKLSAEEISNYMSAADISVLPYKFSTQSGVLSKSWAYKRIVLASDVSPFSYLKKKYNALETFQLGNEQDLVNTIKSLLSDSKKISILHKNISAVRKKRDWNVISWEFWDLLEKVYKEKQKK